MYNKNEGVLMTGKMTDGDEERVSYIIFWSLFLSFLSKNIGNIDST